MKLSFITTLSAALILVASFAIPQVDAEPVVRAKAAKSDKNLGKTARDPGDVPYDRAVDVFVAGEGNPYASVRIPCIVNAGGLLIAAAEGRYTNADQGKNDLIVSTSKDGKKWTTPVVAAVANGATFNNPCLIYDKDKKVTALFFQRYPQGVRERDKMPAGWDDDKCIRNFVCFSKNGKKWTKPRDVTRFTKHEDVTITCSGPNPGVQIQHGEHKGRICVPFNEGPFGNWTLAVGYSDDHGKTWRIGQKSAQGGGVNEVSMVETETGGLMIVSRAYGGNQRRVAYSDDGGETWGDIIAHPDLISPNCQNGLSRYSFKDDVKFGNRGRVIFSSPREGRKNAVIKMSYDDGKTWPVEKDFGEGPFAYSVLTPVKPGVMGILFEVNSGSIKHLRFATFSIGWLTDGEDDGVSPAKDAKSGVKLE